MKLSQLEVLIAIADGQGVAGAADCLNISQPAVTKRLSSLENELGLELVDRSKYRLELNVYGTSLLGRARAIVAEAEKATHDLRLLRDGRRQIIRVNAPYGTLLHLLPRAHQKARAKSAGLLIEFTGLQISTAEKKYRDLAEGVYDLLIYPVEERQRIKEFTYELLMNMGLVILASKDHPATRLKRPSLSDLSEFEWISVSRNAWPRGLGNELSQETNQSLADKIMRRTFDEYGAHFPERILAVPVRQMIFSYLDYGEYLAFLPYHPSIAEDEIHRFSMIDVDLSSIKWEWYLIRRNFYRASAGMLALLDALKTEVAVAA